MQSAATWSERRLSSRPRKMLSVLSRSASLKRPGKRRSVSWSRKDYRRSRSAWQKSKPSGRLRSSVSSRSVRRWRERNRNA